MTTKTTMTTPPDVTAPDFGRRAISKPARSDEDVARRVRKALWLELVSANSEPERAVLRCALNLLAGAEPFEIDPVTGLSRTVAGFERNAARWAEEYAWYDRRDDPDINPYRHELAMKARTVQARYAAIHPQLAEPLWFPDHGPHDCAFCLVAANEAAGLPALTGMDPVTGRIVKSEQTEPVAVALPGIEVAA